MTPNKEIKPSSMVRKATQYLIGCIAILLLLGLFIVYWPAALAIVAIGVIIWWRQKGSQRQVPDITTHPGIPPGNISQPIQPPSKPQPTNPPSVSAPVIVIEYGPLSSVDRPITPGTNELEWASYEDTLEVASYRIEHPMTYWAYGKTRIPEASCIEKHLTVDKPASESRGALGYWPRYDNMTPSQRGNYLHWLATGKQEPLLDIGYAFVYFYGLERRVLIDNKDVDLILPEVVRLLRLYSESGSFNGYLSRFIAFAAARTGLKYMTKDSFALCFEQALQKGYSEDLLAVILCWFYQNNHPLPARWAFEMARQDVRTTRSVVVDRVPEQFMSLFMQKYSERFGDGMMLKAADRERLINYHPASPSLALSYSSAALLPIRIPDVMGIQNQFVPIIQIWNLCIEELRGYSRVISNGVNTTTRQAWEALPPELRKDMDHPDAAHWEEVVTTHAREDGFSLTPLSKLAEIQGFEQRERLTPAQSRALSQTAEDIGLAIVPDARITGRAYAWSDEVVIFRPETDADLQQESGYRAAACMLELGMVIAGADGTVDHEEVAHIEQLLEDQFRLSSDESRRLKAYGLLLSKKPLSISSLSKLLRAALSPDQRALIGKYLVKVAAANGTIDRKEIAALKSTYKALDIDVSALDLLLDGLRQSSSRPVEVQTGRHETGGEVILHKHEKPLDFVPIDYKAVTDIINDTREITIILSDVLGKTESETEESGVTMTEKPPIAQDIITPPISVNLPFSEEKLATLDKRYHAPLGELLKTHVWSSEELTELAKKHQIKMFRGMVDDINTWADATLGDDILIEEGDEYKVDQSLAEAQA